MNATTTYFVTLPNYGRVFETTTDLAMSDSEVLDLYAQDAGYADYADLEREAGSDAEDSIPTVDHE